MLRATRLRCGRCGGPLIVEDVQINHVAFAEDLNCLHCGRAETNAHKRQQVGISDQVFAVTAADRALFG